MLLIKLPILFFLIILYVVIVSIIELTLVIEGQVCGLVVFELFLSEEMLVERWVLISALAPSSLLPIHPTVFSVSTLIFRFPVLVLVRSVVLLHIIPGSFKRFLVASVTFIWVILLSSFLSLFAGAILRLSF